MLRNGSQVNANLSAPAATASIAADGSSTYNSPGNGTGNAVAQAVFDWQGNDATVDGSLYSVWFNHSASLTAPPPYAYLNGQGQAYVGAYVEGRIGGVSTVTLGRSKTGNGVPVVYSSTIPILSGQGSNLYGYTNGKNGPRTPTYTVTFNTSLTNSVTCVDMGGGWVHSTGSARAGSSSLQTTGFSADAPQPADGG